MFFLVALEHQGQQRVNQEHRDQRHQPAFLSGLHLLEQGVVAARVHCLVEHLLNACAGAFAAALDRLAATHHAVLASLGGSALGAFLLFAVGGHR
ncbi:hypothetical protein D3C78_1509830 [compost metagenome]